MSVSFNPSMPTFHTEANTHIVALQAKATTTGSSLVKVVCEFMLSSPEDATKEFSSPRFVVILKKDPPAVLQPVQFQDLTLKTIL